MTREILHVVEWCSRKRAPYLAAAFERDGYPLPPTVAELIDERGLLSLDLAPEPWPPGLALIVECGR